MSAHRAPHRHRAVQDRRTEPRAEPPGLAARRGALSLVSAVLDRGALLDEARLADAGLGHMPPEGRAEARGLADLVLRRLGQIDAALARLVDRKPKPPGVHILRIMAAEMLFGATPPHAAVDSAVRLAHATRGAGRLSGLVNAVGRRLGEGAAGEPADIAANTPGWLRERLVRERGEAEARAIMEAHLSPAPHDLSLKAAGDADALAAETGGIMLPSGTLRLTGRPQLSALPGHAAGAWWVQDAAAALPALLLAVGPGERVLDLCAAPGGKTMQLAAAGAEVTALDQNARRMERLAENLARTGLRANCVTADALEWEPSAPFDAVLLDAPCSATGTIRRHPDLPHRFRATDLPALTALQARLLDRAWGWVAPGGRLVFATCSLLNAEGEAQAAAFLKRTPDAARLPLDADDPALPPGSVTAEGDLRTLPSMLDALGGLDGFFAARFRREG